MESNIKIETDSIGTPLPPRIQLSENMTIDERIYANIINSFVRQIMDCIDMGSTVIYDIEKKEAYIGHSNGFRQIVNHI
jgi:hypothetical protein